MIIHCNSNTIISTFETKKLIILGADSNNRPVASYLLKIIINDNESYLILMGQPLIFPDIKKINKLSVSCRTNLNNYLPAYMFTLYYE